MHGAEPRRREDGDYRLGYEGHVDEHAVGLADSQARQGAGQPRGALEELGVRHATDRRGERTVVDERRLAAEARRDVPVHCVVAGVRLAADVPAGQRISVYTIYSTQLTIYCAFEKCAYQVDDAETRAFLFLKILGSAS